MQNTGRNPAPQNPGGVNDGAQSAPPDPAGGNPVAGNPGVQNVNPQNPQPEKPKNSKVKKVIIWAVVIIVLLVIVALVAVNMLFIGKKRAKVVALHDAGLEEADTVGMHCSLEFENGVFRYDTQFYCDGVEYDYLIHATDGYILKVETEGGGVVPPQGNGTPDVGNGANPGGAVQGDGQTGNNPAGGQGGNAVDNPRGGNVPDNPQGGNQGGTPVTPPQAAVSRESAEETALADAGLTRDTVNWLQTTVDDGEYEVDFSTDTVKYDYKVSLSVADTIYEKKEEFVSVKMSDPAAGAVSLSNRQAKKVALDDIGITESQANRVRAVADDDDRVRIYDVEILMGNVGYEYEIRMADGRILERAVYYNGHIFD